jgi:hypothetical protein
MSKNEIKERAEERRTYLETKIKGRTDLETCGKVER